MTNWLITQYPDRFAAAITGAGITNWISDYGTADIYRTKETEFFGTPWDKDARDRMIEQSPLTLCRQRQDADAVRARRSRSARAVRRGRADVLRAQAPRHPGEDDPVRRPAARHRRTLEQRPPDAQRAEVVEHVSEAATGDDDSQQRSLDTLRTRTGCGSSIRAASSGAVVASSLALGRGVVRSALRCAYRISRARCQAASCGA